MTDEVFDKNAAFEKFKEGFEPSDELAEKAKHEEEALDRAQSVIMSALQSLTLRTTEIQDATSELSKMFNNLYTLEQGITSNLNSIIQENRTMRTWWNEQFENVQQLMLMMAAMGFEIQLPDDKD